MSRRVGLLVLVVVLLLAARSWWASRARGRPPGQPRRRRRPVGAASRAVRRPLRRAGQVVAGLDRRRGRRTDLHGRPRDASTSGTARRSPPRPTPARGRVGERARGTRDPGPQPTSLLRPAVARTPRTSRRVRPRSTSRSCRRRRCSAYNHAVRRYEDTRHETLKRFPARLLGFDARPILVIGRHGAGAQWARSDPVVAVLGGGQLGRMLGLAGDPTRRAVPVPRSRGGRAGERGRTVGRRRRSTTSGRSPRWSSGADVVTYEWEGVPADAARSLEPRLPVRPGPHPLAVAQDRLDREGDVRAASASASPSSRPSTIAPSLDDALDRARTRRQCSRRAAVATTARASSCCAHRGRRRRRVGRARRHRR